MGDDLKGQLDRIDSILAAQLPAEAKTLWDESQLEVQSVRSLAADSSRANDPRIYLAIAVSASSRVHTDGTIIYKMLTKNSGRYAGRPWFIMGAKIIELHEEGSITLGRLEMDPGGRPLAVGARFLSPFVDGDRVDVVGYFAGNFTYETKVGTKLTIPAFAVAGMFKSGTITAMNQIVKVWTGKVGPDQLRAMPRKF